jgi:hypothetical protein
MKFPIWRGLDAFGQEIRKKTNRKVMSLQKKVLSSFFNPQPIFFPPRRPSAFRTWHERPAYATNVSPVLNSISGSDVAIVIQGKVVEKHSFTLETVAIYRKIYPQAQVILSTWNSTKPETVQRARALGATVLLTDEPTSPPGNANVDLQILSTVQGLREAGRFGAKYGLKTRTDQRIYNPMALDLMKGLISSFSPNIDRSNQSQQMRVLVTDLGTFKFRLYSMSDFLHFGLLEDLERIWDLEAVSKLAGLGLSSPPEVFLCSHFMDSIGRARENSLQDWWTFVRDNLIVLDASSLDLFWPKYSSREYRWRQYDGPKTHNQFSFADWMSLQSQVVVDPEGIDQALF